MRLSWLFFAAVSVAVPLHAEDLSRAEREFFESRVRPLLVARCYDCHSSERREPRGNL